MEEKINIIANYICLRTFKKGKGTKIPSFIKGNSYKINSKPMINWLKLYGEDNICHNIHVKDFLKDFAEDGRAKEEVKEDIINSPNHYGGKDNPYEVIKILEYFGLHRCFNLGNTVKYILRAGKKDKSKVIEDLKKARYYLDRKIYNLENGKD